MPSTEIIFLLVGKTGVGKSAVGNTILGEYMFESTNSPDSVTKKISKKSKERKDFLFTVVDTPGLIDTKLGIDEAKIKACKDMKKAMQICPRNGKLAVIFVIKYGERHTEDNKNTLHILENIFGKKNIWKSSIIVMTHGENYDLDHENKLFYDYLKEQKGDFGEIFANCNYKCVLFHNKTKIKEQQEKELQMLINGVNSLEQGFTHSIFEEAYKEQNRLELEGKLPELKASFENEIKRLNILINEIKLNFESSEKLEKLEYEIRQNVDLSEKEDSPKKIYYKKGEPRILEEIRHSFNNLLALICVKKDEMRHMKVVHEINIQIEGINLEITKTDPKQEEILSLLNSFADKIKQTSKLIRKSDLNNEDKCRLKSTLNNTNLEMVKLKMTAEKYEENMLKEKKENIITRLNNVSVDDMEAEEHLLGLKVETESFISSLKSGKWLTEKSYVKDVLKLMKKKIQISIEDKAERVRQFEFEKKFNFQIENLMNEMCEVQAKNDDFYNFICDLKTRIEDLKEFIRNRQLKKDTKDRLKSSLEKVNKGLEDLKYKLQKSQETEIDNLLKTVNADVQKVPYDDKEALVILKEAKNKCKLLKNKIDDRKNLISERFYGKTEIEIRTIKNEILTKIEEAKEWVVTDGLMSRIRFVTQEIDKINVDNKSVAKVFSKHKAELIKLNKEIHEIKVRELFLKRLSDTFNDSERKLDSIRQKRKKQYSADIKKMRKEVSQLDVNSKVQGEAINHIQGSLSQLEERINEEDFDDEYKEDFITNLNSMKLEINVKSENANHAIIVSNFMKDIQNVLSEIGEYTVEQDNLDAIIFDFETKVITLKSNISKSKLRDATKENLLSSLEVAERKFSKRKTDIFQKIDVEIQWILRNIDEAKPVNVNISFVLSAILEKLELLQTRIGDHFQEQYLNCERLFNELRSRVELFNEVNKNIDLIVTTIKELETPCFPVDFKHISDDLKEVEAMIADKIIFSNDKLFLSERINQCLVGIETKATNNKKKIAGAVVRYVPILGPFMEHIITAGVSETDRNAMKDLS